MGQVEAYRYSPPAEPGDSGFVEVSRLSPDDPRLAVHAKLFQRVMKEAWTEQFRGVLREEEISKTVNHMDPDLRARQLERMAQPQIDGQPVHVRADIFLNSLTQHSGKKFMRMAVAVGKSKTAGREGAPRKADISDIYVLPGHQHRGIGTAIYRSLLDGYRPNEQLVAYEYAANIRTLELLERLGYGAVKSWTVKQFGRQIEQVYFRGPAVGDMAAELELRNPWLKDRQSAETSS